MLTYGSLVRSSQESKAERYVPVPYRIRDIRKKPDYKDYNQDSRDNLRRPLDYLGVPPDWYALIGDVGQS